MSFFVEFKHEIKIFSGLTQNRLGGARARRPGEVAGAAGAGGARCEGRSASAQLLSGQS